MYNVRLRFVIDIFDMVCCIVSGVLDGFSNRCLAFMHEVFSEFMIT